MVSYLLLAILAVGIVVTGFAQGVFNDVVDTFIPYFSSIPVSLGVVLDDNTTSVFNMFIIIQKNFLILAYFVFAYKVIVLSQKPVQPY